MRGGRVWIAERVSSARMREWKIGKRWEKAAGSGVGRQRLRVLRYSVLKYSELTYGVTYGVSAHVWGEGGAD